MKRGFTLIELLVIVGIMGLLATIIVANLGGARTNAKNKGIITSMNSMRSGGDLWFTNTGAYAGFCGTDCATGSSDWKIVCSSIRIQGGVLSCNNSATAWVASSSLVGGGTYCVDSIKRTGSTAPGALYNCP